MRFVTLLVLVLWLSTVVIASSAAVILDGTLAMARAYGAVGPGLLALLVWLALPLGRPVKLAGACLSKVLAASAARDLKASRTLLLPALLGLLGATAIAQGREGPPNSRRENNHDR
jgi:hypothetical protein